MVADRHRTQGRLAWGLRNRDGLLGALLAFWAGVVVVRAYGEVTTRPVVQGLVRTWRPPEPDGPLNGPVIDPRGTSLAEELRARYGIDVPTAAPDAKGPGDGSAPRLVYLTGDQHASGLAPYGPTRGAFGALADRHASGLAPYGPTLLVIGPCTQDLVVFVPGVGVVLAAPGAIPPTVPALRLAVTPERMF